MIQARLVMNFSPEKVKETLKILRSIVERTRAETGCLSCSVFIETGTENVAVLSEKENVIMFEEKWRSNEDLQRHLRSDDYQKVLLVIETAASKPEIRFDTIMDSSGVEVIVEARTSKKRNNVMV
jgi:quinol monooxygenase YgiN